MKRTCHPWLIIAYQAGILPASLLQLLPRSTKHEWNFKQLNNCFGYGWYAENEKQLAVLKQVYTNKKLMQINLALLRLLAIKRFMQRHTAAMRQGLQNVPHTIYTNIQKAAAVLGPGKALRLLQLPHQAYCKLKSKLRCVQSPLGLCRTKHPGQLLPKEAEVIKVFCEDERYQYWPLSSVYYEIIRSGKAFFHISTFYKYVAVMNLKRSKAAGRRKNHHIGIRAEKPLQMIHADVTEFRLQDNRRVYIYAVVDNCSRAILHLQAHEQKKAVHLFDGLKAVQQQYLQRADLDTCTLMTDDGSENYGEVRQLIAESESPAIAHIIAQADVEFSNSMVEHAHKELKYQWLYHHIITSLQQLNQLLAQYLAQTNERPRAVLEGLTPTEVLNGQAPEKKCHAPQLQKAAQTRKMENKKMKCRRPSGTHGCGYSF